MYSLLNKSSNATTKMKAKLIILVFSIGLVVNSSMLHAAPNYPTAPFGMPVSQTTNVNNDVRISQLRVDVSSTQSNLYLNQVKVAIPSTHAAPARVATIPSPTASWKGMGDAYKVVSISPQGSRKIKYLGGNSGSNASLTSSSNNNKGAGGPRRASSRLLPEWREGVGGWFDEHYNFRPNNDGGIPQLPYLAEGDALTINHAVPMSTTPYAWLGLLLVGYVVWRKKRRTQHLSSHS